MKVCGIVAEFNPLHNGHEYLINQVKKQLKPDFLIVIMSGNFVQRGEPAIIDKWNRTKMALKAGVDLIIELPIQYSTSSVHFFAQGAIKLLNELGCNYLAFGTENSDFDYIEVSQKIIEKQKEKKYFKNYKESYANQINEFYRDELGIDVRKPNQMLGLNYVLEIVKNDYKIEPFPITRMGVEHDDSEIKDFFASASKIRSMILNNEDIKNYVPIYVKELINSSNVITNDFYDLLKYRVMTTSSKELSNIYQMTEGLENRFKEFVLKSNDLDSYLDDLKTKRYTYSRIRRLMLYILLNIKNEDIEATKPYVRILGFNKDGQKYLNMIKKNITVPLITKVTQNSAKEDGILHLQVRSDSLIELEIGQLQNFKRSPIMEK